MIENIAQGGTARTTRLRRPAPSRLTAPDHEPFWSPFQPKNREFRPVRPTSEFAKQGPVEKRPAVARPLSHVIASNGAGRKAGFRTQASSQRQMPGLSRGIRFIPSLLYTLIYTTVPGFMFLVEHHGSQKRESVRADRYTLGFSSTS